MKRFAIGLFFALLAATASGQQQAAWTSSTTVNTTLVSTIAGSSQVVQVSFNPNGALTAGALIFEVSNDGAAWFSVALPRTDTLAVDTSFNLNGAAKQAWSGNVAGFSKFQVRLSPVITGAGTALVSITTAKTFATATTTGIVRFDFNMFRVTGDFTDASSTALQTITGLSWTLPANTAANYPFHCELLYSQATAAVADAFGIQAASLAPTNIAASGLVQTAAGTFTSANLPVLSTTTATNILAFTPSAITTIWRATLTGLIENPSGVVNTVNVMVSQTTGANLITIKRGSYCVVGF